MASHLGIYHEGTSHMLVRLRALGGSQRGILRQRVARRFDILSRISWMLPGSMFGFFCLGTWGRSVVCIYKFRSCKSHQFCGEQRACGNHHGSPRIYAFNRLFNRRIFPPRLSSVDPCMCCLCLRNILTGPVSSISAHL